MAMKMWRSRWPHGPTLSRLAFGILCVVGLSCLRAGPAATAGDDENFFIHLHTDKAMANVTVSPGRAGQVEVTIQLETMEERPLKAKAVSVTLSKPGSGIAVRTIQAERSSDDRWNVKTSMPASGRWTLGLGITISDTDKVSVESPIEIR